MKTSTEVFERFAKRSEVSSRVNGINAVIYTRVSTKEQAETNLSLETQRKACEQYAVRNQLNVVASFGGTYESAKTDERKEFKRMLSFVKRSREKISFIIVYSVDRFSRSGANAMYIASELKKEGIMVQAVTQPADTTTASGSLQQNIQFIFSQYDNEVRREKVIAGMREKMLHGYWPTKAPVGYDQIRINGQQKIVVNNKGKILRKVFEWKANEGLSNVELIKRAAAMGLLLKEQTLSVVLKNPFYCGIITHNLLEGKVVEGKHEKLISKELFLQVNQIQEKNHQHYKHNKESEPHPLRRFVKCGDCGSSFAGYEVKKKRIHYYKCTKKGCRCNRSAKHMHQLFKDLLKQYRVDEEVIPLIKEQLEYTFHQLQESSAGNTKAMATQITEVKKKVETIEERFALGEIAKEIYIKFRDKYLEEKRQIEKELEKSDFDLSNLDELLEIALNLSNKLHELWELANYSNKEKLQYLLFPEGIQYDRKNSQFRISNVNSVFAAIASFSEERAIKQKGGNNTEIISSNWVIPLGLTL